MAPRKTTKDETLTAELKATLEKRIAELQSQLAATEMALANERFIAETAPSADPKDVENLLIGEYLENCAGNINSGDLALIRTGVRLAVSGLL
jgi:hypothetical protein